MPVCGARCKPTYLPTYPGKSLSSQGVFLRRKKLQNHAELPFLLQRPIWHVRIPSSQSCIPCTSYLGYFNPSKEFLSPKLTK
jgi:hypothetical protein